MSQAQEEKRHWKYSHKLTVMTSISGQAGVTGTRLNFLSGVEKQTKKQLKYMK